MSYQMPDFHFLCRFECHNPLFFALGMLKIAWLPGGFAPWTPTRALRRASTMTHEGVPSSQCLE